MDDDARALLDIYLHDHMAAAMGGTELARRLAKDEPDPALESAFAQLSQEIEEDADALRTIARSIGTSDRAPAKEALAWVGEKLGRLKLNGRVISRSPLSRVLELEGLQVGVNGKLALWRTLRELSRTDRRFDPLDLDDLTHRAEHQREQIEQLHQIAVRRAFE